jgi:nucleoside-diphosphate-sugar epimerase
MWARQAARGEPIEASPFGVGVTEGRTLNQDHPYVLDTAAAIRALLEAPRLAHAEYNISTGQPVFVDDMVAAIRQAHPAVRFVEPIPRDNASTRPAIATDPSRLRRELGFEPRFTLASALAHCIAWRQEVGFLD